MDYALTQEFEGWRPDVYKDTKGNPTIGYGFNLNDAMVKELIGNRRNITKEQAQPIFQALYERATQNAQEIFGDLNQYPPEAQNVFIDMSYNMGGPKLKDFKKMIKAAKTGDWSGVSREMEDSKWYKQVGNRSKKLQGMIESIDSSPKKEVSTFGDAFKQARSQGLNTFEFKGKLYTTEVK